MKVRQIGQYLNCFIIFTLVQLLVLGCTASIPQAPPDSVDLRKVHDTINAAKKNCTLEECLNDINKFSEGEKSYLLRIARDVIHETLRECPIIFPKLQERYLQARAYFYAGQNEMAADLARDIICEKIYMLYSNTSPTAQFESLSQANINELLTFNASASYDKDNDPLIYSWKFGDGSTTSKNSPVIKYRYSEIGRYKVSLTVQDDKCGEDKMVQLIKIVRAEIFSNDLPFDFNKAALKSSAEQSLAEILVEMRKNSSYHARLVGHTDSTGPEDYNMRLSKKRALAVKKYLTDNGIAGKRITTEWKGETDPIAENTTEQERSNNRRTEITLTFIPASK